MTDVLLAEIKVAQNKTAAMLGLCAAYLEALKREDRPVPDGLVTIIDIKRVNWVRVYLWICENEPSFVASALSDPEGL